MLECRRLYPVDFKKLEAIMWRFFDAEKLDRKDCATGHVKFVINRTLTCNKVDEPQFVGLFSGSDLVGFALVIHAGTWYLTDDKFALIEFLYVDPEHRGRGAVKLLRHIENHIKQYLPDHRIVIGANTRHQDNEHTGQFLNHMGYDQLGSTFGKMNV